MALPKPPAMPRRSVKLAGGTVEVRGLTFEEIRSCKGDNANARSISLAVDGVTEDEAAAWLADPAVPAGDVQKLIDAVMDMSGLGEEAQFQD
jgi:hypothetical protein